MTDRTERFRKAHRKVTLVVVVRNEDSDEAVAEFERIGGRVGVCCIGLSSLLMDDEDVFTALDCAEEEGDREDEE